MTHLVADSTRCATNLSKQTQVLKGMFFSNLDSEFLLEEKELMVTRAFFKVLNLISFCEL